MFNQSGLSLDQAPPITVVFKFFFVGTLFGIMAGMSLFFYQTKIFDPSTLAALSFTHLLTLGVMLNFMFAALFQMLPVIAGIKLSSPTQKSKLLLYPMTLGILILILAFNNPSVAWLYTLAALFIGFALFIGITPMITNLLKLSHHTSSSKGMTVALFSLLFVVVFALYLLLSLSGILEGTYYMNIKTAHYSFALFAWVALLIISISFQVIEMFYVTPAYPTLVSKYLPLTLFILLLLSTLLQFIIPNVWLVSNVLLSLLLISYALLTLKRLTQRKRPLTDATVWFWRVGLSALFISMLIVLLEEIIDIPILSPLSYILFATFALSIVFAMFYKIIPFLTWFHLNSQGYFTAPMMHEIIHPKTAKKHLYIHLATIVTFILSLFVNVFILLAGLLMILSFSWMTYQIIHADKLYKETQKNGEKFDMGSMG